MHFSTFTFYRLYLHCLAQVQWPGLYSIHIPALKYYQGLSRRQMNGEQQCFNEFQLLFIRIISPEKQP